MSNISETDTESVINTDTDVSDVDLDYQIQIANQDDTRFLLLHIIYDFPALIGFYVKKNHAIAGARKYIEDHDLSTSQEICVVQLNIGPYIPNLMWYIENRVWSSLDSNSNINEIDISI